MGNHCIDVICLNCGRQWCARGCGSSRTAVPSSEAVERYRRQQEEWSQRWGKPAANTPSGDPCVCGQPYVVIE